MIRVKVPIAPIGLLVLPITEDFDVQTSCHAKGTCDAQFGQISTTKSFPGGSCGGGEKDLHGR